MSRRSEIRAKVKELLESDSAFDGVTVSTDRHHPIDESALPLVVISTEDTDRQADSASDIRYEIALLVSVAVKGGAVTAEDQLDTFADAIERILLANQSLDGLAYDLDVGPQAAEYEDEEYILGVMVNEFMVSCLYENSQ